MWEISVGGQVFSCACALVLGTALCLFYDIIRATRQAGINSFLAVFIGDILFWLLSAVCVFILLVALTNGEVRGYIILSCAAGFLIYRMTLGRLLYYPLSRLFVLIARFLTYVSATCAVFCAFFERATVSAVRKSLKSTSASLSYIKKLLKKVYKMLYTVRHKHKTE